MISIIQHIEYLLLRHDCVVVPGLGAFIAQYDAARCGDGGLWQCPRRSVSFNAALAYNDGLLASSVMRRERCSYETATEAVRDGAMALRKQLEQDGELAVGRIGTLAMLDGKMVFTPYPTGDSNREFYGLPSFSMVPLAQQQEEREESRGDGRWRFSINKSYLKIAASIVVLLVLSFMLTTPKTGGDIATQNYASIGLGIADDEAFPQIGNTHELAVMMPATASDSVRVKGYRSMGIAPVQQAVEQKSGFYLIVCSAQSQGEAQRFIARQPATGYDYQVLPGKGKHRVYVASAAAAAQLHELRRQVADTYPDAWIYHNK